VREALCIVLTLFSLVLLLHVVFSWIPRPPEPILPLVRGVRRIMDPLLGPLRRILPPVPLGGVAIDLSVLIIFVLIWVLRANFACSGVL